MSTPADKTVVLVPMQLVEARVLLHKIVHELPSPIPYNFEHKQWDLMETNLDKLMAEIEIAKLILSAIRKASES